MKQTRPHTRAADLDIQHNGAECCFECAVDGLRCVIDYRELDGVMQIFHTEVPPALMVRFALSHAREHALKIDPQCSYVRVYMQRHPETHDLRV